MFYIIHSCVEEIYCDKTRFDLLIEFRCCSIEVFRSVLYVICVISHVQPLVLFCISWISQECQVSENVTSFNDNDADIFFRFVAHVKSHAPKDLLSLDEFLKLRMEHVKKRSQQATEEEEAADGGPPGDEAPPGSEEEKVRWRCLGLFLCCFFHSMENMICCNFIPRHSIATNCCTCHKSVAVMSCAKVCNDHFVWNGMRAIWNFELRWKKISELVSRGLFDCSGNLATTHIQ